jgi:cobalt-zinc-cadmium efflux system outer membrane protein
MQTLADNLLPTRILGKDLATYQPSLDEPDDFPGIAIPAPDGALTLLQARALAMKNNPGLAAQAWALAGESGQLEQAGLLPNPELSVEVENFAGDNDMKRFDSAETTLAVSQLVELGGKRSNRKKAAELQQSTVTWDYEAARLDTLTAVTRAHIEVVGAQNRLKQAQNLAELAAAVNTTVTERVEAGKVSPLEQTRSAVVLASARLAAEAAQGKLERARRSLAAFWGSPDPRFSQAIDSLTILSELPALDQLLPLVQMNPDVARWGTELERSRTELALVESRAIPDLTVSFGIRNFQEDDSNALVAGLSFPLPLFDRQQGGRKTAASAVNQVRHQRDSALSRIQTSLSGSYQELTTAHTELNVLTRELLPGAQSAFEAASFGYREGKFGFLDVLDAQRTLFEVRGQLVSARVSYHLAQADIERLIAQPLRYTSSIPAESKEVTQ